MNTYTKHTPIYHKQTPMTARNTHITGHRIKRSMASLALLFFATTLLPEGILDFIPKAQAVGEISIQGGSTQTDPYIQVNIRNDLGYNYSQCDIGTDPNSLTTYKTSTTNGQSCTSSVSSPNVKYTLPNTAGAYTVYLRVCPANTGKCSSSYSLFNTQVNLQMGPAPSITTQPANATKIVGQTATFSVVASNATSYQWRKNGTALSGATAATYTTPSLATSDNGNLYSVVVTGAGGSTTSSNATLTVTAADTTAPRINIQSLNTTLGNVLTQANILVNGNPTTMAVTKEASVLALTNPSDAGGSGLDNTSYKVKINNGTETSALPNVFTLGGLISGINTFVISVRDIAGNLSTDGAGNVYQDTQDPSFLWKINGNTVATPEFGWTKTSPTLDVACAHNLDGCKIYTEVKPMGSPMTCSAAIADSSMSSLASGTFQNYTINDSTSVCSVVRSISGRTTVSPTYTIKVDKEAPTLTLTSLSANTNGKNVQLTDGIWYSNDANIKVQWASSDGVSGIKNTTIKVDNAAATTVTGTETVLSNLGNGTHTLTLTTTDNADNPQSISATVEVATTIENITGTFRIPFLEGTHVRGDIDHVPTILPTVPNVDRMVLKVFNETEGNIQENMCVGITQLNTSGSTVYSNRTGSDITLSKDVTGTIEGVSLLFGAYRGERSCMQGAPSNLPRKTDTGAQITYRAELTIFDIFGNSTTQTLSNIKFDTKSPEYTTPLYFSKANGGRAVISPVNVDGVNYIFTTDRQMHLQGYAQEFTDSTTSSSELFFDIKDGDTHLVNNERITGSTTSSTFFSSNFTLPNATFKGPLLFNLTDYARNTTSRTINFWHDGTNPTSINVSQVLQTPDIPTQDLTLRLQAEDGEAMSPRMEVLAGTSTYSFTLPDSFLSADKKTLSGDYLIPYAALADLNQGSDSIVVKLFDAAGNEISSNPVTVLTDHTSPIITKSASSYQITPSTISLALNVRDHSPLQTFFGSDDLGRESRAAVSGMITRVLQLSNIALTGKSLPYVFTLTDGVNQAASFSISDGLSILAEQSGVNTYAVSYTLLPGDATAQVQMTVTPPAGLGNTQTSSYTGSTGSMTLTNPAMGTYTVTTTVTRSGQATATFTNTFEITKDIIAPQMDASKYTLIPATEGKSINYSITGGHRYFTNDSSLQVGFAFLPYTEQSLPVKVFVDGVERGSITSIDNQMHYVTFPLGTANTPLTYRVRFEDTANPANSVEKTFDIIRDTTSPIPSGSHTSLVEAYKGTTDTFTPNASNKLVQSAVTGAYLTDGNLVALVINAKDSWNLAPKVRIMNGSTEIAPSTEMTQDSRGSDSFTFIKKDIAVPADTDTTYTVEITNFAGTTTTVPVTIRQYTSNPSTPVFTIPGLTGGTTQTSPITGTVSSGGKSGLSTIVVIDNQEGQPIPTSTSTLTDQPVIISFPSEGSHVVKVIVVDELGHRAESNPITVIYDKTAPTISDLLVKAPNETTRALSRSNVWYTNSPAPLLSFTTTDTNSGVNQAATTVELNGARTGYSENMVLSPLNDGNNTLRLHVEDTAGNPQELVYTIVFDAHGAIITGNPTITEVKDLPNPGNSIAYSIPAAKDMDTPASAGSIGLEKAVLTMTDETGTAVNFTGKITASTGIAIDTQDSTKIVLTPDANGLLPVSLTLLDLAKTTSEGAQKSYTLHMQAVDFLGNGSTISSAVAVTFDTLPPTFQGGVGLVSTPSLQVQGVTTYYTTASAQTLTFNLQEHTNSGRSISMPMLLKGYVGSPRALSEVSSFIVSQSIAQEGQGQLDFTLPDNYTGELTFVALDNAGNVSSTTALHVFFDNTAPEVPASSIMARQVRPDEKATNTLTLALSATDNGALSPRMSLIYGGNTHDFTLPNTIFTGEDHKTIQGSITLTQTDLPNFPQGDSTDLSVVLYDLAGNPLTAPAVATRIDWVSPVVSNISYSFLDNKQKLNLTFTVGDTSTVRLLPASGTAALYTEPSFTGNTRTLTINDIALSGTAPFTFRVSDDINAASTITINDGYILTRGAADTNGNVPLTYTLSPSDEAAQVHITIEGPANSNFTGFDQTFTGSTDTFNLTKPSKGTYTIRSVVTSGANTTNYDQTIEITEDLIPLALSVTPSLHTKDGTKTITSVGGVYYTNDTALVMDYQFQQTFEESFPVRVILNNTTELKRYDTAPLPTGLESVEFALGAANVQSTYTISFEDNGGNRLPISYTIVRDAQYAVPPAGTSLVNLYKGVTPTFVPNPSLLLSKNSLVDEYLIHDSALGIEIVAQDEWNVAPSVSVQLDGGMIIDNESMNAVSGSTNTFTYTKGDITLAPDMLHRIDVEVKDAAGNKVPSTYFVRQVTTGPKLTALTVNNGILQTATAAVTGTLSATSTSALRYEVLKDGTTILGSGSLRAEVNPLNAPFTFTLPAEGAHNLTIRIYDELTLSDTSGTFTMNLDTTPPSVNGITVRAVAPNTQARYVNSKWFTNDDKPMIMVDAQDNGSGMTGASYIFSINGVQVSEQSSPNYQLLASLIAGDNTLGIIIKDSAGAASPEQLVPVVFDNGQPEFTGSMTISDIQDLPAPNHYVDIALPGVKDKDIGGYGVSGVEHMSFQIRDAQGQAVDLTNRLEETALIQRSTTDATTAIVHADTNGVWPTTIKIKDLPKTQSSAQAIYSAHLVATDLAGNSSSQDLQGIRFDTTAPSFAFGPNFSPLLSRTLDGTTWIFTNNKNVSFSFTAGDSNNSGRTESFPLALTVTDEQGTTILSMPVASADPTVGSLTLPDNFKGILHFVLTDTGGNASAQSSHHLWLDTTAPTALSGASSAVYQDLGSAGFAPSVRLTVKAQDEGTVLHTATLSYGTTTVNVPLPIAAFTNQDRTVDGIWDIPVASLPGFPQGDSTALSVTLRDAAGNNLPVQNIAVKLDSLSPVLSNISYTFKDNGQKLDLSFTVDDLHAVETFFGGNSLNKETTVTNQTRTITLNDIAVSGTGPFTFLITDGINPAATIVLANGFAASFGNAANEVLPLTYTLSGTGDIANADVALSLTGPSGFTPTPQTATLRGATGSMNVQNAIIGTYTLNAVVTVPGNAPVNYALTLPFTQDIIAPKVDTNAYVLSAAHAGFTMNAVNNVYYTNDTDADLAFAFSTYTEDSFPVVVRVNGATLASYGSLPSGAQHIQFALQNPDQETTYTIAFEDAAGNSTTQTYRIYRDTKEVTTVGNTLLVRNFVGTTDAFDSTTATALPQSSLSSTLLTKDPLTAFVITAQDELDLAPSVRITEGSTEVLPWTTMDKIAANTFTLTKKDAALRLNSLQSFLVEIRDVAGNITAQTITIQHDNQGPRIVNAAFNDGNAKTTTIANFGTASVSGTSALRYDVLLDNNAVSSGTWNSTSVINAPLSFSIPNQGDHTVALRVRDELDQTSTSTAFTLTLDSLAPEAQVTFKDINDTTFASGNITNSSANDPIILTPTQDRITGTIAKLAISQGSDAHFPVQVTVNTTGASLQDMYAQTPNGTLADTNATFTMDIPLPVEGANTITLMLKDDFGNAHSMRTTIMRDSTGPATTLNVTEDAQGNLIWNWTMTDAQNTPIAGSRIVLRNTTLGNDVTLPTTTFDNTVTSFTLPADRVRRGETYALTLISSDTLGNDSLPRTVEITPVSHTFDEYDPLTNTDVSIPWQNYPDITQVKITLTDAQGTSYTATMPKTTTVDLPAFISAATNGTKNKLPIGVYDALIEPVTTRTDITPTSVHQTITITPYYMDAGADLNGDGFGGGISDYTLYKAAKDAGNIYRLIVAGPMTEAQQKQDEELQARGTLIESVITQTMNTTVVEFLRH